MPIAETWQRRWCFAVDASISARRRVHQTCGVATPWLVSQAETPSCGVGRPCVAGLLREVPLLPISLHSDLARPGCSTQLVEQDSRSAQMKREWRALVLRRRSLFNDLTRSYLASRAGRRGKRAPLLRLNAAPAGRNLSFTRVYELKGCDGGLEGALRRLWMVFRRSRNGCPVPGWSTCAKRPICNNGVTHPPYNRVGEPAL